MDAVAAIGRIEVKRRVRQMVKITSAKCIEDSEKYLTLHQPFSIILPHQLKN
jgi:hypothetical protein